MIRKIHTILLIAIFLQGCEEQFDWFLDEGGANLIVVEAVMTNENRNHLIKLTRPHQVQNQNPEPVTGAAVRINTIDGPILTIEFPAGSGMYYTDSIRFVGNKNYTLVIQHNSKTYSASAIQPGVEPLPTEELYRAVEDSLYTLNFPESGEDPSYIKHYLYWKHLGNCSESNDCQAKIIQYDLKNVDVNEEFEPTQESVSFPAGTVIIRRKYSVSDNYREYLRGMLSETAWRGGAFDVYPANAQTNLSEGAVGFFAISRVVSDTILVVPLN